MEQTRDRPRERPGRAKDEITGDVGGGHPLCFHSNPGFPGNCLPQLQCLVIALAAVSPLIYELQRLKL